MQIAERIYERLQPEERFRAAMEAFGRHDLAEIDRLNDTCPYETVRVQSLGYFGRLRGFNELAMMHGISARDVMLGIWACISKLFHYSEPAQDYAHEQSGDASEGEPSSGTPETGAQECADEDDETCCTLQTLVARLRAHRGAWAEFCASLGVDPEKTHFAYYRQSQDIVELFDWVEPDQEYQAELVKRLREAWDLRVSRSEVQRKSAR